MHSTFTILLDSVLWLCDLKMGVDSIFQSGKADFSGLARNATNELCVTQMLQKVVLEVNEVGSAKLPSKRFY